MEATTLDRYDTGTVWTRMLALTESSADGAATMRREEVLKNNHGQYLLWQAETEQAVESWQDWQPAEIEVTALDEDALADWYKTAYEQDEFNVLATDELIEEIALELGEPLNIHVVEADSESPYPSLAARYPDSHTMFASWLAGEQDELAEQLDALRQQLLTDSLDERTVTEARLSLGHLERGIASLQPDGVDDGGMGGG
jgi:hypothetical protein